MKSNGHDLDRPSLENSCMKRIETDAIDKLRRALDIPDREIGGFADLQRSGFGKNAKRLRGVACCGDQTFLDRQPEERGAHIHGQEQ